MPLIANDPLDPAIVPAVVVPSPQLIVATNSLARAAVSVSVNVATVALVSGCPAAAVSVVPWRGQNIVLGDGYIFSLRDGRIVRDTGDGRSQREVAFVGVGVAAFDRKRAVRSRDRGRRSRSVAPVDGRDEAARQISQVAVGKAGDHRVRRQRHPFGGRIQHLLADKSDIGRAGRARDGGAGCRGPSPSP